MDAYCFCPPSIPREEFILLLHQVFVPQGTSSRVWRSALLKDLFGSEVFAQMFIDVCCQALSGSNLFLNKSDDDLLSAPTKQLMELCHKVLDDGPGPLLRVAASPGIPQKLISSLASACQRERCFDDPYGDYNEMILICFRITR